MAGVTYDAGALVAADRNDRKMWALHAGYLREEVVPMVPAPVLAQAWRGSTRQARVARLLQMCDVEPLGEALAKDVGVLAGRAKHDVAVVEGALRRGDAVVTSDPGHVRKIAAAAGVTIWIEPV